MRACASRTNGPESASRVGSAAGHRDEALHAMTSAGGDALQAVAMREVPCISEGDGGEAKGDARRKSIHDRGRAAREVKDEDAEAAEVDGEETEREMGCERAVRA